MSLTGQATPANIVLGEGAFYFNYGETGETVVGATRGGGSFKRAVEIKDIEFDGARGSVKGMRRKTSAVPTLTLNALELQTANLTKFYAGLKSTFVTDHDVITANPDITDADYLTNVAFVGSTKDGRPVVIIVKNALGDGDLELKMEDKDEIVPEIQFTGHYDLANLDEEPWEIHFPATA
jgi:hypothetical protein